MKNCYLIVEQGAEHRIVYPLLGPATIGRVADNTICLDDPAVSRKHVMVTYQNGAWTLEDVGSTNGIVYNGNRVARLALNSGDVFRIGDSTFRFIDKSSREGKKPSLPTIEILTVPIEEQGLPAYTGGDESWGQRLKDAIAHIPFFSHLEENERNKLADTGILHLFTAGEIIIREGDAQQSIYVILAGRVRVLISDEHGREFELAVLEVSQFFGEMSFLTGEPRSCSVAALETSVLIELSATIMRNLIRQHPPVKGLLLKYYQDRLADLEEKRALAQGRKA